MNWKHVQGYEISRRLMQDIEISGDDGKWNITQVPYIKGHATKISTNDNYNNILIKHTEGFKAITLFEGHSVCKSLSATDSFSAIRGVSIVDHDGKIIPPNSHYHYLTGEFTNIDYDEFDFDATDNNDTPEMSKPASKEYFIKVDNQPDIRFEGMLLAHASYRKNDGNRRDKFKQSTAYVSEYSLYQTKGGKYICHAVHRDIRNKNMCINKGEVAESVDEIIKCFGYDDLAKEIYKQSGLTSSVFVE